MTIQERLESLIRGNPNTVQAFLREVCKSEPVDNTRADMHIYMLRLDGNNRPRTNDFVDYLVNRIVDYCIPPSEIRNAKEKDTKYNTLQYSSQLFRKAERLFTNLENTGEAGELALSVLVQSVLQMPQVLCKMPLKTNPEVHYHGADGVYGKYDAVAEKFYLYWGESKIYSDVGKALSDCFDSLKEFLTEEGLGNTRKERDMSLFRANLDFDDPHLEAAILQYLDPENLEHLKLEYRGVCLVGYNEEAYPKDLSKIEDEIYTEILIRISDFKSKIEQRLINRTPLDKFALEVFLIPFESVDDFREQFQKLI